MKDLRPGGARRLIVLLDDNDSVRDSLTYRLTAEGFDVVAYPRPDLLLEASFSDAACLVVNYHMPSMNGLELVARLRERGVMVPFLLHTGDASGMLVVRAGQLGGSVVPKPSVGAELLDHIKAAVQGRGPFGEGG